MANLFSVLGCALVLLLSFGPALAFDANTHRVMTAKAVLASELGGTLNGTLGFLRGVFEPIGGGMVEQRGVVNWIVEGAVAEDEPDPRVVHHFHDPTQPWEDAGLSISFFGESSAVWGQDALQIIGGRHSWYDARNALFEALTSPAPDRRQTALVNTFRSLGQLMHLVQDAASPAHTRNDPHLPKFGLKPDSFHVYPEQKNLLQVIQSPIVKPDPSIFAVPPANPLAPLPVAHLIDTEQYRNNPVPQKTLTIGLAEYSNANFLSDDRRFTPYAFPSFNDTRAFLAIDPDTGQPRSYLFKLGGPGETNYRLAAINSLSAWLFNGPSPDNTILDSGTLQDYGRLLYPRAIGYSSALIDHFFRGKIEITPPDRFAYGVAPYLDGNKGTFPRLKFKIRNATPNESAGTGTVVAVVRYRTSTVNIIDDPKTAPSLQESFKVSQAQTVTLTPAPQEVTFDFIDPIPANAADLFLTVVYRGPLGAEPNAVAIGGKDISEPTAMDIANISDWYCFGGQLFNVTTQPRDVNGDGIQDLFGPIVETGVFMKVEPRLPIPPQASPLNFDASVALRMFPQFTRFMVIVDQPTYRGSWFVESFVDTGTTPNTNFGAQRFSNDFLANLNKYVLASNGSLVHVNGPSVTVRGVVTMGMSFVIAQDLFSFNPCFLDSFTKTPNLQRIDTPIRQP